MPNFYDEMDPADAQQLERLSRLMYELRENRAQILAAYNVADEVALLERIYDGSLPEHPAYEHYLSARILADTRESVRVMVGECLRESGKP